MRYLTPLVILLSALALGADQPAKIADVKEPELRSELLARMKVDQDARKAWIDWEKNAEMVEDVEPEWLDPPRKAEQEKLAAAVEKIDKQNTGWMKELVNKSGWPTITRVGTDGALAAWILAQHADADPKFQRKCLDLMTKLPEREISRRHVALLTDRVLLAEGKKQIYGTQFDAVDGKFVPKPIEDEANVDRRRAEVGLEPLAEYAKQLAELYGGTAK